MSKYTFNVNNFSIEKDKQFFAYINVMDANRVVKTLNKQEKTIQELKKYISRILFVFGCSKLPEGTRLSDEEIEAISKLQNFIGEEIIDLEKKCSY